MANAQMTQKEMYAFIAEQLADNAEVVAFCNKKIKQITDRKVSPRKVNPEVQERRDNIKNYLETLGKAATVKDIAEALGYTSPQVSGAIRGLVNAGNVEVIEPEQKSKPKTYAFKAAETDVENF